MRNPRVRIDGYLDEELRKFADILSLQDKILESYEIHPDIKTIRVDPSLREGEIKANPYTCGILFKHSDERIEEYEKVVLIVENPDLGSISLTDLRLRWGYDLESYEPIEYIY